MADRIASLLPPHLALLFHRVMVEEELTHIRHDVRSQLAAIGNAAFYLRRKVEKQASALWAEDSRVPRFFEIIAGGISAIDQRLGGGVLPDPAGGPITGDTLIARHVAALAPSGPAISVVADHPVSFRADELELELALHCLLGNALEAARSAVTIRCAVEGELARLEVEDDGLEPPAEAMARALEPFFTTKPHRVGLGLNVAQRLAQRWGGDVTVARLPTGVTRSTLTVAAA